MHIQLNGEHYELPDGSSVADLIARLEIQGRLAVEVNESIVPRSRFAEHQLQEQDRVEVVRAIGGG